MDTKRQKPRPLWKSGAGLGASDVVSPTEASPDYPTDFDDWKVPTFWLHVKSDGTELRFDDEPHLASLLVEVIDDEAGLRMEQTTTRNIKDHCGAFCDITSVRPRGEGWVLHSDASDNFTVWRRPVPSREAGE